MEIGWIYLHTRRARQYRFGAFFGCLAIPNASLLGNDQTRYKYPKLPAPHKVSRTSGSEPPVSRTSYTNNHLELLTIDTETGRSRPPRSPQGYWRSVVGAPGPMASNLPPLCGRGGPGSSRKIHNNGEPVKKCQGKSTQPLFCGGLGSKAVNHD